MTSERMRSHMTRFIQVSISAFVIIEISVAAALAITTTGARLVGFETYGVLSGSMEPNIHNRSLVYVNT